MKIKTVSIDKIDVQNLTGSQLELLSKFEKSKEYEIFAQIAQEAKTRRAFEGLGVSEIKELAVLSGMNIGIDFMMDTVRRAKEELKARGAQVDSEE